MIKNKKLIKIIDWQIFLFPELLYKTSIQVVNTSDIVEVINVDVVILQ